MSGRGDGATAGRTLWDLFERRIATGAPEGTRSTHWQPEPLQQGASLGPAVSCCARDRPGRFLGWAGGGAPGTGPDLVSRLTALGQACAFQTGLSSAHRNGERARHGPSRAPSSHCQCAPDPSPVLYLPPPLISSPFARPSTPPPSLLLLLLPLPPPPPPLPPPASRHGQRISPQA